MTTTVKITAGHVPVEFAVRDRYVETSSSEPAPRGPVVEGEMQVQRTEQVTTTITTETVTSIVLSPTFSYEGVCTDTRSVAGIHEVHPN